MTDETSANPHEEASRVGHFGLEVDPTPDEHYTLDGVTLGRPTPETTRTHRERVPQAEQVDPANLNAEFAAAHTAEETTSV